MIPDKYIELINQEIDGVNSPKESLELKQYLEKNPEGKRCYEELRELCGVFREVKEVAAPPNLRELILSAISRQDAIPDVDEGRRGFIASALAGFRFGFKKKYAYIFAAGLIAGIVLFTVLSRIAPPPTPDDLEKLYGTISLEKSAMGVATVVPVDFELASVSGSARFRYMTGAIMTELNLSSEAPIEVVFEYDEKVSFDGFRALDKGIYDIRVAENSAELSHLGDGNFLLIFKDGFQSPIMMKIFSEGDLVFEESVYPGRK
ncbi:MAG: hypothetical protein GTO42_08980 [Candidatus Latescibacteria bacterium]|nr:hypothetical protein [Candidatus Latescibacterota bacterium]NIO29095.1 hypothetical protein [Candidatus Latescibacterota bacterium]NIO56720.1 hypothetical protein [Candidatus Latescibacterota bacterium]NIT02303.1 hypothetical protein [Candidatus Latescibacterota bacterium]NIT39188.1 hypothetical protein [Candidatus Latescibacterota bacterium]